MIVLALLMVQQADKVYYAWGWHGGYYLTDEVDTRKAFDKLFELLEALPNLKAILEIEPYTVERMLHGEKFEVERRGRSEPRLVGWQIGGVGKWASAIGAISSLCGFQTQMPRKHRIFTKGWVNLCKRLDATKLRGKQLELSAWVRTRHFGAHIYIDAHDDKDVAKGSVQSGNAPADGRWHQLKVSFRVPDDTVFIFPQCRIISDFCEADFDGVGLKVVKTGEELLPDGSFESETLPRGWSVGKSEGAECTYELHQGDAVDGQRFVKMKG